MMIFKHLETRSNQTILIPFSSFFFPLFCFFFIIMKIESDIPHRTTSYQRLVEKLKRNPSERADTKDWPRPNTPKEVIQHAIKGATSKFEKKRYEKLATHPQLN